MKNEYPLDEDLEKIRKWDLNKIRELFEFIEEIWWTPERGFVRLKDDKIQLHTGGWSGNEDIIDALLSNYMVCALTWCASFRGGHYLFEIKEIKTGG